MSSNNRKRVFGTIGAKITISHVTVAVVLIIFASLSMFLIFYNYMSGYMQRELLEKAKVISHKESGKREFLYDAERAKLYEEMCSAGVLFFDRQYQEGEVSLTNGKYFVDSYINAAYNSSVQRYLILDGVDRYFLSSILSGTPMTDIRSFQFGSGEVIFAGAPIYGEDGSVQCGVLLLQPVDMFNEQTKMMLHVLIVVSSIAIPISVIISWRYSVRLTKPLINISAGAQLMAGGDFSQRITQVSGDEIGDIASSLNSLSARLQRSISNLRRERDMLDLIMNGINEGILAVDWYMHTVHCNDSFLRIMEMERMPEEVSAESEYGSILKASMKRKGMNKAVWTDSSGHRLFAVSTALHSGEGIVIGAVCLVQDISEAERLEQMRKDYIANVSHELRTPLTGIRGMVEPLIDGVFETEAEKQDCYGIIYKETIRLEKLIRDMLDMSKLQDGRLTIETETIEVRSVINDAITRIMPTAAEADISVIADMCDKEDLLFCVGNEDRVLQVLTIYLDNALSFTPKGGKVVVYSERNNSMLRVGVRDTGCGIEPKDAPYIWERFFKVDKSRMRTSGTGLGLAIAKSLVEHMHGEVGVNSEPGAGTDIWFELPI